MNEKAQPMLIEGKEQAPIGVKCAAHFLCKHEKSLENDGIVQKDTKQF